MQYGFKHTDYQKVLDIIEPLLGVVFKEGHKKQHPIDYTCWLSEDPEDMFGDAMELLSEEIHCYEDDGTLYVIKEPHKGGIMKGQFEGIGMTLLISDEQIEFNNKVQSAIASGILEATTIHWPVINWDEEM
jgi:hypothetical protein